MADPGGLSHLDVNATRQVAGMFAAVLYSTSSDCKHDVGRLELTATSTPEALPSERQQRTESGGLGEDL
jgi:hypothetical protein